MNDTMVVLIHGFNVWDGGKSTIGKLEAYYEAKGADVYPVKYGWFGLLMTRFFNEEVADIVTGVIRRNHKRYKKIIVVGHSNGCSVAHLSSFKHSISIHRYVYINPALKRYLVPDMNVERIDVWHNDNDKAVILSKLLFWRASERPWGMMGCTGYVGKDPRFVNYDTGRDFKTCKALGHSSVFSRKNINFYGDLITSISLNRTNDKTTWLNL